MNESWNAHRWAKPFAFKVSQYELRCEPIALHGAEITNNEITRLIWFRRRKHDIQSLMFRQWSIREHGFELAQGRLNCQFVIRRQLFSLLAQ